MSSKIGIDHYVETLPLEIENGATYSINQTNPNSYTHSLFKYPCRFIPELPRWGIRKYLMFGNPSIVFDPFAGSGTTLLESIIQGYDAAGTEIDKIAKLLIKVKTTSFSSIQLKVIEKTFDSILSRIDPSKGPSHIPEINNLEHWFSRDAIVKLSQLKNIIDNIPDTNIQDFFKICFVSIIKRVSFADDVSPKPYVSRKVIKSPPDVIDEFKTTFFKYFQSVSDFSDLALNNKASLLEGDALSFHSTVNYDLAITSPPYINAFDYPRTMRLENLWLDTMTETDIRSSKQNYVGTETIKLNDELKNLTILQKSQTLNDYYEKISKVDLKRALIVKKFFQDMEINLQKIFDSLNANGHYMIVIGNSMIRDVEIESWYILEELANIIGFSSDGYFKYIIQNPYIRIPRKGRGGKIQFDHVLTLSKGR